MASLNIRQRGAAWQIRVRHQGHDHYRYAATETEARTEGARFAAELGSRGAPPASAATSFAAWAESWMTLATPGLAPATAARYRELLDLHVLPALGSRRIGSLTAGHGLDLQRAMLERGLSPVTIWSALRLAKALTAEALRLGVIGADPLAAIRHLRQPPRQRDVLPPERFAFFFSNVSSRVGTESGTIGELIALALATGLRRGELLALRWRDIEADFAALAVTGSLCPLAGRKTPKTLAGARRVALPPAAAELLRARRIRAAERALAAGVPLDSLPVFPGPDGLSFANPDTVSQQVRRALPDGVSLHGLRHAHATALISAGINPRAVQARLGHADIRTTLGVYAHALPRDDAQAIAVLEDAMGGPARCGS
jgi:integrase